jgi:hypothetical protein
MSKPLVGLRLPQAAIEKLNALAARSLRKKSDVVTLLLLSAEVSQDGGLRFTPPCAQASSASAEVAA